MSKHASANRLQHETSPYLLQHAHNPVDWFPWGEAAFEKARAENKPVLLSVGYSACHWCHVMAHECFESEPIAAQMNEHFVNIKVDREERPDVDEIYQRVTQLINGQGGWPLTVFLTPQGDPVYGGTYFPPTDMQGRPGFPRVMQAVLDAYHHKYDDARKTMDELLERMRLFDTVTPSNAAPTWDVLEHARRSLISNFDMRHGGFGAAPKFPMVADQLVLLAHHRRTGERDSLERVLFTLQKMASGGIYDQLGGGFHRYSVDAQWLAPHFEKMLYDNALIPRLYLEAWRQTDDARYAETVHHTLGYLMREMQSPEGGFYAAQDADSEGVEGKFFVWKLSEVREVLGPERADAFAKVYDVTEEGNWEHLNILRVIRRPDEVARELGKKEEEFQAQLAEDRQQLFEAREKRVEPGLDDKIIAAWNGLALGLFAQAGSLLDDTCYLDTARRLGDFLLTRMWDGRGMKRIFKGEARIEGFLDDHAYVMAGLLDLYRATSEARWLGAARDIADRILSSFRAESGAFYMTPAEGEKLPSRPLSTHDQMLPSPGGMAVHGLLRLAVLTGEPKYREAADAALRAYAADLERYPTAYAGLLLALDLYHRGETTCVIAGDPEAAETRSLLAAARRLLPLDEAVVLSERAEGLAPALIEGRVHPERPTAYVCHGFACRQPARTPGELAERLG